MKKVRAEIMQSMRELETVGLKITSRFIFREEFIGFQGHFPDKKILPGVCQVQCVLSTLEKGRNRSVILKEIVLAKYFSPVAPNEEITCVLNDAEDNGQIMCKALISRGETKVAELKLRVEFSDEQE